MVTIQFSKVRDNAIIPSKRDEDAGYDIYACFSESYLIINSHQTVKVPTGIASSFSADFCMILKERGSTGTMGIGQRSGVIDSGYRNEWLIPVTNHNDRPIIIIKEDHKNSEEYQAFKRQNDFIEYSYEKALCQALLVPVPRSKAVEVSYEELLENKSERMLNGFGSTNK
ncbi:MAG: dUTP pyrophosphatase [Peptostreptococcaceae bacterium]|nr:dUTP pyrophosphatase [Peptostreptococcaceae bacterium]